MTETEKAWIAGYFDGEGSIVIKRTGREKRQLALQVQMSNNRPHAIEWLHDYYGGTFLYSKNPNSTNISARWSIVCDKATLFLEDILPYLKDKKRRALLALAFQRYKAKTKLFSGYGKFLPEDIRERRDQFRRAIKRLNHTKYDEQYHRNTHNQGKVLTT